MGNDSLKKIAEICGIYASELSKVTRPSKPIQEELRLANGIVTKIHEEYLYDDDFSMATVDLDESVWALIRGLCLAYIKAQRALLEIEKRTERIAGSTELSEQELDQLESLMDVTAEGQKCLGDIKPRAPLLKDFMVAMQGDSDIAEKTLIQLQVGDVYGQMIVSPHNSGTINQSTAPLELIEALKELTEAINGQPALRPEYKNDALGDVQGIQAQITKSKPSKKIIKALTDSLGMLADATQVGTAAVILAPHIDKVRQLIDLLPFD